MKDKKGAEASITKPLLKDLIDREKLDEKYTFDTPASNSEKPLDPPALYEDSGEGYNANFVFPQD